MKKSNNCITFSDGTPIKVSKSIVVGGSVLITSPLIYFLDQVIHMNNLAFVMVVFVFAGMAVANTIYRYFTGKDID